ncbi:MAG: PEGA domain-containing protein [Patescibacteria group bacterium]
MIKFFKNYLFHIFVFLFIVLTIIISLYASGYKFNLSWPLNFNRLLQKTGMLAVSTIPKNALIYLDDKVEVNSFFSWGQKNYIRTPAKIKNILPGEYKIRFEEDGYWPFEKKITIYSGQTTFLEDINLFRSDLSLLVSSSTSNIISLSPNQKYLYIIDAKKVINLASGQIYDFNAAKDSIFEWLDNGDKLFSDGIILNFSKNSSEDLKSKVGIETKNWFYDRNNNRFYYQNNNSISYITGNNISVLAKEGENYLSFVAYSDHIFYISEQNNKIKLQDYSLKTQKIEQVLDLPSVGKYRLSLEQSGTINLYDSQNKTLYLINQEKFNEVSTLKNIISWQWINSEELFYNNDWEIHHFNLTNNRDDLITRLGENITKVIFNQTNNYLIFSGDKKLNALDLKSGAITDLLSADKISDPWLDEKNDLIYFSAKINGQAGIYKIIAQ